MHLLRHSSPQPLPASWRRLLEEEAAVWGRLGADDRKLLEQLTVNFATTKEFEPAGGIDLNDRVVAVISAHAAVPILRLGIEAYHDVHSVIVYPSTVVRRGVQSVSRFPGVCRTDAIPLLGETLPHGPVLVVWDAAVRAARHPEDGRNVVYHEFAHKLDMLGGVADGIPPLPNRSAARRWQAMSDALLDHMRNSPVADPVLGSYAEFSRAELFAVATETFFTVPHRLQELHISLYEALAGFYQQDPAAWDDSPPQLG